VPCLCRAAVPVSRRGRLRAVGVAGPRAERRRRGGVSAGGRAPPLLLRGVCVVGVPLPPVVRSRGAAACRKPCAERHVRPVCTGRRGGGARERAAEGVGAEVQVGGSSVQGRADAGAGVGQGRGHPRGCTSAAPGLCGGALPPRLCALERESPPGALPPRPSQPRQAGPAAAAHAPWPRRSRRGSASRARWRASARPCARAWGAVRRRASSLTLHSHSPGTRASYCRSRATTPRPARRRRTRVGVRPGVRRGAARQAHAPGSRGRAEGAVARAAAGVAAAARGVQELRHRRPPVVVPRLRAAPDARLAGPPPLLARVPPAARRERAAHTDPGVRLATPRPAPPRAPRAAAGADAARGGASPPRRRSVARSGTSQPSTPSASRRGSTRRARMCAAAPRPVRTSRAGSCAPGSAGSRLLPPFSAFHIHTLALLTFSRFPPQVVVDLDAHFRNSRMHLLAFRPAPLQVRPAHSPPRPAAPRFRRRKGAVFALTRAWNARRSCFLSLWAVQARRICRLPLRTRRVPARPAARTRPQAMPQLPPSKPGTDRRRPRGAGCGTPGACFILLGKISLSSGHLLREFAHVSALPSAPPAPGAQRTDRPGSRDRRSQGFPSAPGAGARKTEGLPARGLVIANFNQLYKIDGETFALWLRVLQRVAGAVLWLRSEKVHAPSLP
jgi:hypothetical protein